MKRIALCALVLAAAARADEGMWTFDNFPSRKVAAKYHFSPDAAWLNGAGRRLTPDLVAMMVLDSRRRTIQVQGLSAEEPVMAGIVDAIDTATRAASNLIFAYLQVNNL